jgi:hypothetical protein
MDIGMAIGRGIGVLLAPAAAVGSFLRGARIFHPDGVIYRAEVHADVLEGALGALAERLAGPALVRLSSATRTAKAGTSPRDILGLALRFNASANAGPEPNARSQDLLLLSFAHLWQLPIGALLTNPRDFLANEYHALVPFRVDRLGVVKFRIVPEVGAAEGDEGTGRIERLESAIRQGRAVMRLQVKGDERGAPWSALATVVLRERVDIDQAELRFTPFQQGAGIEPAGFIQGLRWAVYPASQLGRDLRRRLGGGR